MYLTYETLRYLTPEATTTAQQRAADERLGELAAVLSRGRRGRRLTQSLRTNGNGSGGLMRDHISKSGRKTAAREIPHHAA
jgi:hypothetical protein